MTLVERVARAIEDVEFGYNINLTKLVDGVSTYTLSYKDGEKLEFEFIEDAHEHIAARRNIRRAVAAIEAMREPTSEMVADGWQRGMRGFGNRAPDIWIAMIDAALEEWKNDPAHPAQARAGDASAEVHG